jgi:hypothetical protein
MIASLFVVYTLYNREFRSKAVRAITLGQKYLEIESVARHSKAKKKYIDQSVIDK